MRMTCHARPEKETEINYGPMCGREPPSPYAGRGETALRKGEDGWGMSQKKGAGLAPARGWAYEKRLGFYSKPLKNGAGGQN